MASPYFAKVEVCTVLEDLSIATPVAIYLDVSVFDNELSTQAGATTTATLAPPLQRVVALRQTKLRTVQIRLTGSKILVTTIEILSPDNKCGEGLEHYRRKRTRFLLSNVHVVELDLLRAGKRPGEEIEDPPLDTDYVCLVNRATAGGERISHIRPVALNEPLPRIPLPLLVHHIALVGAQLKVADMSIHD